MENKVIIYTDGGCYNNGDRKGDGSCAFLIKNEELDYVDVVCEYIDNTTNNRTEMKAVINAIKYVNKHMPDIDNITIVSDSGYLVKGFTDPSYMDKWIANGWRTYNDKPVKNVDMWKELYRLSWHNHIKFIHIRGHNKDKNPTHAFYNDICDKACTYMLNESKYPGFVVKLRYPLDTKSFDILSIKLSDERS